MKYWLATINTQFSWGFRRSLFTWRSLLIMGGLSLLLLIQVIVFVKRGGRPEVIDERFFPAFHLWATLSILVPLGGMFLGVSALLDDTERGSIVYLISRPVPRAALVLGRALGAGAAAAVYATVVVTLSYILGRAIGKAHGNELLLGQFTPFIGAAIACSICFVSLGVLLGAWSRKGLLWGIAFVLLGELLAGSLLARGGSAGIRSLLATDLARRYALCQLPSNVQEAVLRHMPLFPTEDRVAELLLGMGQYTLILIVLAMVLFFFKEHPYKNQDS